MFLFPTISLRVERWKFNKDFGVYVSTLGNFKDRHKRNIPIKITQEGYCAVKTEAIPDYVWAHRLVMFTWKPIANAEQLTVDHLNHNKRDNSLANLEWVTREENLRRAELDYIPTIVKKEQGITVNAFSTKISLEKFQNNILGYEINGHIYKDALSIWRAFSSYFSNSEDRKNQIFESVDKLYKRENQSGVKRIGNKKRHITISIKFKEEKLRV